MDIFNTDKLILFLIFFVPGFISTKIWSLIMPSDYKKISDYLLEVVSYGCINFAIWFYPAYLIKSNEFCFWVYLFWVVVLFISPILWPIIISAVLKSNFLKGKIIHPIAKPWDYFFKTAHACYVLIHLKNGQMVGGLYGSNSFASSFPSPEEIYLEEVWKVDQEGRFWDKIENSNGIWISKDFFNYIEFLKPVPEEE